MTKYTTINAVKFETYESKYTKGYIKWHELIQPKRLEDCYDKPSKYKEGIYYKWLEWFDQTENVYSFGVISYNTFQFTLGGILFDLETGEDIGYIQITKAHNRLYLFKD